MSETAFSETKQKLFEYWLQSYPSVSQDLGRVQEDLTTLFLDHATRRLPELIKESQGVSDIETAVYEALMPPAFPASPTRAQIAEKVDIFTPAGEFEKLLQLSCEEAYRFALDGYRPSGYSARIFSPGVSLDAPKRHPIRDTSFWLEDAGTKDHPGTGRRIPYLAPLLRGGEWRHELGGKLRVTLAIEAAKYRKQAADFLHGPEERELEPQKAKRGPKANMDFHRAVTGIVNTYGDNWWEESNLEKIAEELDRNQREKKTTPPSKAWAARKPPLRTWQRAVSDRPDLVIKAIARSLKMAARDHQ